MVEFVCKDCGNHFIASEGECDILFLDFKGNNGEIAGGNKGYWSRCPACQKNCFVIEE